jgi:predicted phage terminase large subunit-like protein
MKIDREAANAVLQISFGAFCYKAFEVLHPAERLIPNWHIDAICYAIEQMVRDQGPKMLTVNLPPRSLKSHIISVCLPAWLLGRNPSAKIVCASYSQDLANKFSRDCRALMESRCYHGVFPRTRLNPKKSTESEFETTRRGFRFATSVGGTLTGRGGRTLIVDDPIKSNDANSAVALAGADEWFHDTAINRQDSADALVLLTMQRLHQRDLSGTLIDRGWPSLVIPAIATESRDYLVGEDDIYHRPEGEVLQPGRDTREAVAVKRLQVGSRVWAAQYQQNPTPAEGLMIKADWLRRYDFSPAERKFRRIVLACDPAGKAGPHNDYTAVAICGFDNKEVYLLHVARGHWTVVQMRDRIKALAAEWNIDLCLIEDTSSGMGLIQLLRENSLLNVKGVQPKGDKVVRMSRHEGRFEAGNILFPKEAPWLADFLIELLGFPGARYDDQVDALLLFLDWFSQAGRFEPPMETGLPIVSSGGGGSDRDCGYDPYLPSIRASRFR